MVVEVKNMQVAKNLFGDWQETLIWSCLEKIMGEVYGDQAQNPDSAMAILGDFCFFAGKPNRELVLYKPEHSIQNFIIMIPQNEQWAELIAESYGKHAKRVTRYAMKKEADIFSIKTLQRAVDSLSKEYEIQMIAEELYHLCKANGWSQDLVSQYRDYQEYQNLGIGVAITRNGELVSGASSYSRYQNGIEIEIDTKEKYRRKGLAYCCGAKLMIECLKRKLYPSWDAQNKASVALAEKLGYHFDYAYSAYEIWDY